MKETFKNELYQRVKEVAKFFSRNINEFAQSLGQNPRTFYGYLRASRQDNLWPLLPTILKKYPRLSRQWLYFGEGPMTIGYGVPLSRPVPLNLILAAIEEMELDAKGIEKTIYEYIAGTPRPEGDTLEEPATAENALRTENLRLHQKIEKLQDENRYLLESYLTAKNERDAVKRELHAMEVQQTKTKAAGDVAKASGQE